MKFLTYAEATITTDGSDEQISLMRDNVKFSVIPIVNPRDDYDRLLRDNGWTRKSEWIADGHEYVAQLKRWAN